MVLKYFIEYWYLAAGLLAGIYSMLRQRRKNRVKIGGITFRRIHKDDPIGSGLLMGTVVHNGKRMDCEIIRHNLPTHTVYIRHENPKTGKSEYLWVKDTGVKIAKMWRPNLFLILLKKIIHDEPILHNGKRYTGPDGQKRMVGLPAAKEDKGSPEKETGERNKPKGVRQLHPAAVGGNCETVEY